MMRGPQNGLPQTAPTTPPTTAPGGPATIRPVPAPATAPTVSACAAETPIAPAKIAAANNPLRITSSPLPHRALDPSVNYHTIPFHKVDGSADPQWCRD